MLGAAILVAYSNSFEAGFAFDNKPIILDAARVHVATWQNVADILTTDYWAPGSAMGEYRPLATLSYLVQWAVLGSGDRPFAYHVVNILLHWGNTALVYLLCVRALGLARVTAFFVGLLFATHPVASEGVTNIIGRADLLAAGSVLGCLALYVGAQRATGRRRLWLFVALGACAFLGFVSKESSVVVVFVLAVYELVYGLPSDAPIRPAGVASAAWRLARDAGSALAAPVIAILAIRHLVFERQPPVSLSLSRAWLLGSDLGTALGTELKAFGRSVWVLLWPRTLCVDYNTSEIPRFAWQLGAWEDQKVAVAALVLVMSVWLFARLRRRHPAAAFWLGFFLVAVLPIMVLHLFVAGIVAERLLYLPIAGFAACVVLGLEAVALRIARSDPAALTVRAARRDPRAPAWALLAMIAVAYSARTIDRNRDWRDNVSLFSEAVASCGNSYKSHHGLAGVVAAALATGDTRHGTIDRVVELEERAVAILAAHAPPGERMPPDVLEAVGAAYLSKSILAREAAAAAGANGEQVARDWAVKAEAPLAEAAARYEEANRSRRERARGRELRDTGTPQLYNDLGLARLYSGDPAGALAPFARARDLAPADPEAYLHLVEAHGALGRGEEALASLVELMLVAPGRADFASMAQQIYAQVEPGGCAFAPGPGGRVQLVAQCASAKQLACRAFANLALRAEVAPNVSASERAATARRWREAGERQLGCAPVVAGAATS